MVRRNIKRAAMVAALVGVTSAIIPAVNAEAIKRVTSGCPRSDYAKLWNENVLCFANAGGMNVAIYNVNMAAGGNNTFRFSSSSGGSYVVYAGQQKGYVTIPKVTHVSID